MGRRRRTGCAGAARRHRPGAVGVHHPPLSATAGTERVGPADWSVDVAAHHHDRRAAGDRLRRQDAARRARCGREPGAPAQRIVPGHRHRARPARRRSQDQRDPHAANTSRHDRHHRRGHHRRRAALPARDRRSHRRGRRPLHPHRQGQPAQPARGTESPSVETHPRPGPQHRTRSRTHHQTSAQSHRDRGWHRVPARGAGAATDPHRHRPHHQAQTHRDRLRHHHPDRSPTPHPPR